jgi:hypothetical protein
MPRPWFTCQPVDETFFEQAPVILKASFEVVRPAQEVWDELVGEQSLAWCSILDGIVWTSPRPYGVGTTRTVTSLKGLNVLDERFFRWEEGRRKSFYAVRSTGPMFRRFAEDYLVEPVTDGSSRMTWTIAFEPQPLAKLTTPVNRRILSSLFRDTRKHYAALG